MDFMNAVNAESKPEPQIQSSESSLPLVASLPPGAGLASIRDGLAQLEKGLAQMEGEANGLVVHDEATKTKAIAIAGGAMTLTKHLKNTQGVLVAEPESYVKAVKNLFKGPLDRLAFVAKSLKDKAGNYEHQQRMERAKEEAAAREEARRQQERIDAEARRLKEEAERKTREAEKKLRTEKDAAARALLERTIAEETAAAQVQPPVVVVPVVTQPETVTRTETGSGHLRMVWDFRLVNEAEIPHEYLMPDEKKIRQAVKNGVRQIPGVEIFEKPVTTIRT